MTRYVPPCAALCLCRVVQPLTRHSCPRSPSLHVAVCLRVSVGVCACLRCVCVVLCCHNQFALLQVPLALFAWTMLSQAGGNTTGDNTDGSEGDEASGTGSATGSDGGSDEAGSSAYTDDRAAARAAVSIGVPLFCFEILNAVLACLIAQYATRQRRLAAEERRLQRSLQPPRRPWRAGERARLSKAWQAHLAQVVAHAERVVAIRQPDGTSAYGQQCVGVGVGVGGIAAAALASDNAHHPAGTAPSATHPTATTHRGRRCSRRTQVGGAFVRRRWVGRIAFVHVWQRFV